MSKQPIAIIGIGCRFPGQVNDAASYWRFLAEGRDAVTEVPEDRWSSARYYGGPKAVPGKMVSRLGATLRGVDLFDAEFFGIPKNEAAESDPQHRLLLEVAWEAIEDAGLVLDRIAGSATGVFVGIAGHDYAMSLTGHPAVMRTYSMVATKSYMAANRISYAFDLRGPSVALDAACATSLASVNHACESIWSGQSSMALAAGVNLMLTPWTSVAFSQLGTQSPDGRCHSFDARANGYVRAEGVGAVVLKPLDQAIADRDPIYATVRAAASAHGGRCEDGWMVPRAEVISGLLARAYHSADLPPRRISYIEAHGTGTPVGDPIESTAIGTFAGRGKGGAALPIGSVKSNVGHGEAAAGIMAFCKAALMLEQRQIPPTIGIEQLNPAIDFQGLGLRVPQQLEPLEALDGGPRVVGVNSFGVGGSDVHVVLAEHLGARGASTKRAPVAQSSEQAAPRDDATPRLFAFSARHPDALAESMRRVASMLEEADEDGAAPALEDLAYTLGQRRTHHGFRATCVASTHAALVDKLESLADELEPAPVADRPLAFVFSGMGPQWWAMGRDLLAGDDVVRESLQRFDALWRPRAGWSLIEQMSLSEERCEIGRETRASMTAGIALQIALARRLIAWGLTPEATIGHSVGEVAAAHIAGITTLEQVVDIAHARISCVALVEDLGGMAAVGLPEAEVRRALAPFADRLSIAAVNSPRSVTISGDLEAIDAVHATLGDDVFFRKLDVNVPYHGLPLRARHAQFAELYPALRCAPPQLRYYSSVEGAELAAERAVDTSYWLRNFEEPVRFADALSALVDDGHRALLEIGPHPVLGYSIGECLIDKGRDDVRLVPTLRREVPPRDERAALLEGVGRLFCVGVEPRFEALSVAGGELVKLPAYAWQHESLWVEPGWRQRRRIGPPEHPLLGTPRTSLEADTVVFEHDVFPRLLPFMPDHQMIGRNLLPGASYLEMADAALVQLHPGQTIELRDVRFVEALDMTDVEAKTLRTSIDRLQRRFFIESASDGDLTQWTRHVEGGFALSSGAARQHDSPDAIAARCPREIDVSQLYAAKAEVGCVFGPTMMSLASARANDEEAIAEVSLAEALRVDAESYRSHPVLIDAAFQTASIMAVPVRKRGRIMLPVGAARARFVAPLSRELLIHTRLLTHDGPIARYDLTYYDRDGRVLGEVLGYESRVVPRAGAFSWQPQDWLFVERFEAAALDSEAPRDDATAAATAGADAAGAADMAVDSRWLVVADRSGRSREIAARWAALGARVVETTSTEAESLHGGSGRAQLGELLVDTRQVVYLAAIDDDTSDAAPVARCADITALLRAIEAAAGSAPRLVIVTSGGVRVGDGDSAPLRPAQAPLWGLGRVLMAEHGELATSLVDVVVAEGGEGALAGLLAREIGADRGDAEVAWRDGERSVCRLQTLRAASGAEAERKRKAARAGSLVAEQSSATNSLVAEQSSATNSLVAEQSSATSSLVAEQSSATSSPIALAQRDAGADDEPPRFRLTFDEPGSLEALYLERVRRRRLAPDDVEVRVAAAALNFRDVLKVLGIYPTTADDLDARLVGDELCGVITRVGEGVAARRVGERVVARKAGGCLASHVTLPQHTALPAPEGLSDSAAATAMVVYSTVHHSLGGLARLERGERLLVHSASGGVGLAAVHYARHVGAEVFATAGSERKRAYLRELGVAHVMDSRKLDFADEVLAATSGEGVDVVLNALAGPAIAKSFEVLRSFGRFIELGKRDIYGGTPISLQPFQRNLSYFAVDLARLWREKPSQAMGVFEEVRGLLDGGALPALPCEEFSVDAYLDAFRFMAQARHIGKIAVRFCGAAEGAPEQEGATAPARLQPSGRPNRLSDLIAADGAYLVSGGLGGFGLVVGRWLAQHGAGTVALMGRRGVTQDDQRAAIAQMREAGAEVIVVEGSVSDADDVAHAVSTASASRPLRGVVHAAGVLADKPAAELTAADFAEVIAPKARGAWLLHEATREMQLEMFVLFSSAAAVYGSPTQGNYAAANRYLDALAELRRAQGHAACSISWGALSEVGMSARVGLLERNAEMGRHFFTPDEAMTILGDVLERDLARLVVAPRDWGAYAKHHRVAQRISALVEQAIGRERDGGGATLQQQLRSAARDEALQLLTDELRRRIAYIAGVPAASLTARSELSALRLDSLMRMELGNWARHELSLNVGARELGADIAIGDLAFTMLAELRDDEPATQAASDEAALMASSYTGESAPVLPGQLIFLDRDEPDWHPFLPVTLRPARSVDPDVLEEAAAALVEHHPVLRSRFVCDANGRWRQTVQAQCAHEIVRWLDVSDLGADQRFAVISNAINDLFAELSLADGRVFFVLLVEGSESEAQRIVPVLHHVACDATAFVALVHDLMQAHEQLGAGELVDLPPATPTVRWAQHLQELGASDAFADEVDYWLAQCEHAALPPRVTGSVAATATASAPFSLNRDEVQRLRVAAGELDLSIADVFNAATAWAAAQVTGRDAVPFHVMHNGRGGPLDVTRTMGFLVQTMPVVVEVDRAESCAAALPELCRQLRAVPGDGLGYNVLASYGRDAALARRLRAHPGVEIGTNFSGTWRRDDDTHVELVPWAVELSRDDVADNVEVKAQVVDGELRTVIYWPEGRIDGGFGRALAETLCVALRDVASGAF